MTPGHARFRLARVQSVSKLGRDAWLDRRTAPTVDIIDVKDSLTSIIALMMLLLRPANTPRWSLPHGNALVPSDWRATHVPLSTLRRRPHGHQRMTRGHRGSLTLRCRAFPSPPPCRLIPALPNRVQTSVTPSRRMTRVLAFCLVSGRFPTHASVAELADALGLGPVDGGFDPSRQVS